MNADGYISTDIDEPLTYNMFAYCGNNPVMYSDPSGMTCALCVCTNLFPCPGCGPKGKLSTLDLMLGFCLMPPSPLTISYNSGSPETLLEEASYISDFTSTAVEVDVNNFTTQNPLNTGFSGLVSSSQKVSTLISVVTVGYEAANDAYNNYYNGASGSKIAWDVTVDVAISSANVYYSSMLGGQIGAAIGTAIPIPGMGTIVGASAGILFGALAGYAMDDLTKPARTYLKGLVS